MPFQTVVYRQPAPGIEGDWASANPHHSILWGEGGLVAGPNGLIVGRFGFINAAGQVRNDDAGYVRIGFVQKDQPVLITTYLGGYGMTVPAGQEVAVFDSGDFFARFAAGATIGQKVFAKTADGTCVAGAAGATVAGAIETQWFVDSTCLANELAMISTRG